MFVLIFLILIWCLHFNDLCLYLILVWLLPAQGCSFALRFGVCAGVVFKFVSWFGLGSWLRYFDWLFCCLVLV